MKKTIKKTMMTLLTVLFMGVSFTTAHAKDVAVSNGEYNNVGNGEPYSYVITEVDGDEIHGKPLNKISYDNRGIFLYQSEVSFNVKVGDKITVVWGDYEDEFVSIDRMVSTK